ncbi:MAG: hypothetical protein K0S04_3260 [Herbinix sp.]|jgi:photosystem II stability/assembly factor-like uncharacterized protein|nr:hypothetical protein [Herbinix sp.]
MKKRCSIISTLLIGILLIGTLLTGCSQKQEDTNENPEVTNVPTPAVTTQPTVTAVPDNTSAQSAEGAELTGSTPLGVTIYQGAAEENSLEYIYITSTQGWKAERNAEGMFKESITLYKTVDGGANWDKLTSTEDENASIPLESKSGIIFTDSNDGWITTQIPQDGYIGLFRTKDGGVAWEQQELTIPEEYSISQFNTYPPVFFTAKDGLLLSYAFDDEPKQLVYVTHDGGDTWTQTAEKNDSTFQWSYTEKEDKGQASGWTITYENKTWTTSDALVWNDGSAK